MPPLGHVLIHTYSPLAMVEWSLMLALSLGESLVLLTLICMSQGAQALSRTSACAVCSFLLVSASRVRSSAHTAMHLDASVGCEFAWVQEKEISSRRILNVFTTSTHLKCFLLSQSGHHTVEQQGLVAHTTQPHLPSLEFFLIPWYPTLLMKSL